MDNRQELIAARASREACAGYAELIAEAAARGYRRATLYEQTELSPADLYCYRNEIFVKEVPRG